MAHIGATVAGVAFVAFAAAAYGADDLRVLPDPLDGGPRGEMVKRYLLGQIDQAWQRWQADYEQRKTTEQIAAYQKRLREEFLKAIGPFPERTPLNAKVVGTLRRKGYRVEKILFESQPRLHVTAALFLPDSSDHKPPHPGVLVPCGHAHDAKAHTPYQTVGASLALHGMAALVFDPIDQGERIQLLDEGGKEVMWGTRGHTMAGVGAILIGRNTAWYEIWDGMRAIDYLQSRTEVDPNRIGCTGNSGGGTQTSYLMALDRRIKAAAPSCFLNRQGRQIDNSPGDAEQNIFGQLRFGMDHADYVMMLAPRPVVILAATRDFFDIRATWVSYRYAKRLYSRMGHAERVDLLENDEKHNYNKVQREGAVRWMSRWLLKQDLPIVEPPIEPIAEKDLWCTPRGQVMLLAGARNVYDLNAEREKQLAERRRKLWADTPRDELLGRVRKLAGIRRFTELPTPKVRQVAVLRRDGHSIEKLILEPEPGISLPALLLKPDRPSDAPPVLYVAESGFAAAAGAGGAIGKLIEAGRTVLAVDLRGTGETQKVSRSKWGPEIGHDWDDVYKAYLLGRSYVGMRAEDVLVCARWLAGRAKRADGGVALMAEGNVGVPALHAAALEREQFPSVKLTGTVVSWSNVVHVGHTRNQLVNTVHAALQTYDLPDLAATLGKRIEIDQPVDAAGKPLGEKP
ncbi:MAG: acetylxylan esterase [Phycisphaerae bacterium]